MKNLKIWQKLLLLAVVFTLPFLIVTASLLSTVKEQVDFAQGELTGVDYALPLLELLVLVREDLDLAAQARELPIDLLELAHELDHADVADQLLELGDARLVVVALLRQLLAQGLDAAARLVVVEESRPRRKGRGERDERARRDCRLTHRRT